MVRVGCESSRPCRLQDGRLRERRRVRARTHAPLSLASRDTRIRLVRMSPALPASARRSGGARAHPALELVGARPRARNPAVPRCPTLETGSGRCRDLSAVCVCSGVAAIDEDGAGRAVLCFLAGPARTYSDMARVCLRLQRRNRDRRMRRVAPHLLVAVSRASGTISRREGRFTARGTRPRTWTKRSTSSDSPQTLRDSTAGCV